MQSDDPRTCEMMEAISALQTGDRLDGRRRLLVLWEVREDRSGMQSATIAHFLADTEHDVTKELEWDLRALQAATGSTNPDEHADLIDTKLSSFLPSLHLNVGDAYRCTGEPGKARLHAIAGMKRAECLPDDGYGATVKAALLRLRDRVG